MIQAYEGVVKDGRVQVDEVELPENARVYVVIPESIGVAHIYSPRLVNRKDAALFEMEVTEIASDDFQSEALPRALIMSPRLANPKDAPLFKKTMVEVTPDHPLYGDV